MINYFIDTNLLHTRSTNINDLEKITPSRELKKLMNNSASKFYIVEYVIDEIVNQQLKEYQKKVNEIMSLELELSKTIIRKNRKNITFTILKKKIEESAVEQGFEIIKYNYKSTDFLKIWGKAVNSEPPFEIINNKTSDKGYKDAVILLAVENFQSSGMKILISHDALLSKVNTDIKIMKIENVILEESLNFIMSYYEKLKLNFEIELHRSKTKEMFFVVESDVQNTKGTIIGRVNEYLPFSNYENFYNDIDNKVIGFAVQNDEKIIEIDKSTGLIYSRDKNEEIDCGDMSIFKAIKEVLIDEYETERISQD